VGEAVGLAQVNRRAASADFQTFVFRLRRVSPRRARYFLAARQESTQRNAPRLPGPSGCPRCEMLAGPVAKLAGQKAAGVGQRDRTSPSEPSSLGGSEGMKTVALRASGTKYYPEHLRKLLENSVVIRPCSSIRDSV
jgi:hypothetical protein